MDLLEGLKVVDFTRYFPGPYATMRLSDWGAEVVKVEAPGGEPGRFLNRHEGAEGSVFRSVNRGKRAVFADLKDESDKARVLELVRGADALIEGFRPGVMERLGFGYDAVSRVNPGIVYCSLSGYGQTGPHASASGHDLNYLASSGCLDQLLDDEGRPIKPQVAIADLVGGIAASEALLAGLVRRGRTGEGCHLDVSMAEAVLGLLGLHAVHASLGHGLHGEMDPSIAYHVYETSDGRFVTIAAMEDKFWESFCEAVGRPDLRAGKNTLPEEGNRYYEEVRALFKSRDFAYWRAFSERADCCFAPVLTIEEAIASPGFRERGLVREAWGASYVATHPRSGPLFVDDEPYPALRRDPEDA